MAMIALLRSLVSDWLVVIRTSSCIKMNALKLCRDSADNDGLEL